MLLLKFTLTHTFLVLAIAGLGHGVCRKIYTLIGGQRSETFENHCLKTRNVAWNPKKLWATK